MSGSQKRKIILFLGAGASVPFGFPTTQKFLNDLKIELGETAEGALLADVMKIPYVKDIEQSLS